MGEDQRREDLEYYRERSEAPGVREGGGERNHYCLSCNGLIPLHYDRRQPAASEIEACPHCGAELDPRVRAMFNWVEIDQVPASDFRALLPWMLGLLVLVIALVALAVWWLKS
jgi:hypothetical protein